MQVTTLNKIINLFLVGTFANILLLLFLIHIPNEHIPQSEFANIKSTVEMIGAPTTIVVATFILLSSGIMFGIIVDAISNLLFKGLIKKAYKIKWARYFFACGTLYREQILLLGKFNRLLAKTDKYKRLGYKKSTQKAYATAILFHTANKENIEWAIQHYSFYLLSTNYLLILSVSAFLVFFIPLIFWWKIATLIVILLFIYALFFQAVHKYLYTYVVTFRHCIIILSNDLAEEKEKEAKEDKQTETLYPTK